VRKPGVPQTPHPQWQLGWINLSALQGDTWFHQPQGALLCRHHFKHIYWSNSLATASHFKVI